MTFSRLIASSLAGLALVAGAYAQSTDSATPTAANPTANQLLAQAEQQAGQQHKAVFLLFHASWCIWCHRIDAMLADSKVGPIFDKNFVIVHVDGMEAPAKKNLENPGWEKMLAKYHGTNQGIPYWLFLSPKGKVLSDCNSPNDPDKNGKPSNMGFPDKSQPKDEDFFISVLKKAGAKLSDDDVASIKSYLAGLDY